MKNLLCSLIVCSVALCGAQGTEDKKPDYKKRIEARQKQLEAEKKLDAQIVTRAQAIRIFQRADSALQAAAKLPKPVWKCTLANDKAQLTRSEVIEQFAAWEKAYRPYFTRKARPVKCEDSRIVAVKNRPVAIDLIKKGILAPYGPLVTDKLETVSIGVFGDAVGMAISRIADFVHRPSREFSPQTMKPG